VNRCVCLRCAHARLGKHQNQSWQARLAITRCLPLATVCFLLLPPTKSPLHPHFYHIIITLNCVPIHHIRHGHFTRKHSVSHTNSTWFETSNYQQQSPTSRANLSPWLETQRTLQPSTWGGTHPLQSISSKPLLFSPPKRADHLCSTPITPLSVNTNRRRKFDEYQIDDENTAIQNSRTSTQINIAHERDVILEIKRLPGAFPNSPNDHPAPIVERRMETLEAWTTVPTRALEGVYNFARRGTNFLRMGLDRALVVNRELIQPAVHDRVRYGVNCAEQCKRRCVDVDYF
jgi:hypothetical protein